MPGPGRTARRCGLVAALAAASCGSFANGQKNAAPPRRARPPVFSDEVRSAFVDDFRDLLDGPRPTRDGSTDEPALAKSKTDQRFEWSRWIDGETLAAEIKRTVNSLGPSLSTPGRFKSGGHQACQRDFGLLAALFGVASQFDKEVRFQGDAANMCEALAVASAACESGDDAAYAMATARKAELDDLLRGQSLSRDAGAESFQWSDLADRALLMQRMETALEDRIGVSLENIRTFRRKQEEVRDEAQLLSVLAEIVARKEYEFWDDASYAELAAQLRDASRSLAEATDDADLPAARAAAALASQSCADCHDGYR